MAEDPLATADVAGIGDTTLHDVPICTVAGLINTDKGTVIGIFNQYAHHGKGSTIHSAIQFEAFRNKVNDRPRSLREDGQMIITHDGHRIPLKFKGGLA